MKTIPGKEFVKILEKNGWKLLRINGSHHIYGKQNHIERITVPIHKNQNLKLGLLHHIMKIADISETEL